MSLKSPSLLLIPFFALAVASDAGAQTFNKTFSLSSESSDLEVINQTGSIRITAGRITAGRITAGRITAGRITTDAAGKVVVNARQNAKRGEEEAKIEASQPDGGKVKIEVTGRAAVDFEIVVPPAINLNLLCYKCSISVANITGAINARNTEGAIHFTGLRSPRVEAHSAKGQVSFAGEILPSGNYTLKSFSGRVDATLPVNGDFKLQASCYRGGMDLGNFPLKFEKQTDQLVEAALGSGKATVLLWTQEGSIHLHRKP